jgi:hypothetical protein
MSSAVNSRWDLFTKKNNVHFFYELISIKNEFEFDEFLQFYTQGVIKTRGNILNRKLPRHLKTICTGWNCEFKNSNSPHSGPWSTKTITIYITQEIWHWHWIVSEKRTKNTFSVLTLFTVMHGPLEKLPCLETVPGTVFTFGPRTVREHHIR